MQSRARALGHAMHPTLIVFPLGLFSTAVVLDILWLITAGPARRIGSLHGKCRHRAALRDQLADPVQSPQAVIAVPRQRRAY